MPLLGTPTPPPPIHSFTLPISQGSTLLQGNTRASCRRPPRRARRDYFALVAWGCPCPPPSVAGWVRQGGGLRVAAPPCPLPSLPCAPPAAAVNAPLPAPSPWQCRAAGATAEAGGAQLCSAELSLAAWSWGRRQPPARCRHGHGALGGRRPRRSVQHSLLNDMPSLVNDMPYYNLGLIIPKRFPKPRMRLSRVRPQARTHTACPTAAPRLPQAPRMF